MKTVSPKISRTYVDNVNFNAVNADVLKMRVKTFVKFVRHVRRDESDSGIDDLINGEILHRVALPDRGAMPVPTVADVDGDGTLEIVVSLKDAVDRERQVFVYSVPGSGTRCLPWPTGRGNLRRTGCVR